MNLLAKRLPTILGILLLVGLAMGGWYAIQKSKPVISEETRPTKVRITNVADNKFTISWVTKAASLGMVEYGVVGEKLDKQASDERDVGGTTGKYKTHHVTVTGLQPSTQYAFRILSGEKQTRFDNNGSPYSASTGAVIGATPLAESFYGEVELASGRPAEGSIVYVALPGAQPASVLVKSSGSYSLQLSTIRTTDGNNYVEYDRETAVVSVSVESGEQEASATVALSAAAPVPTITLGQNHDFLPKQATVAEVGTKEEPSSTPSAGSTPTIFNVEPLSNEALAKEKVILLNPAKEGEEVATTMPEFRGLAPEATVLSITVHSSVPYSGTVTVASDGTWEWTPPAELSAGEHTISINYIDTAGIEQTLQRTFTVSTALAAEGDPSFEATPSGQIYASPTPSLTATASPRVNAPSTESGVPVSGVTEFTLLTGALGIVIMVIGALMLAI